LCEIYHCHYTISGYHSKNCQVLTCCMGVSYEVRSKEASSLLFHCILNTLWAMIIFWCGYVKCDVLYKIDCVWLIIHACHLWEMPINIGLNIPLNNMEEWKGMWDEPKEVNSTEYYRTSYVASCWVEWVLCFLTKHKTLYTMKIYEEADV
jgi:hypothetical protein